MIVRSLRDLKVWNGAMDLAVVTYGLASLLPKHELFGLTSQMRRASVSIPCNIAEGHGRLHRGDFLRSLSFARGSLRELATLHELSIRLDYVSVDESAEMNNRMDEVGRMLHGTIKALQRREAERPAR